MAVGRDSSVGIATGYGLDGPGIGSLWGRDFLHPGAHPASYTMHTESFSRGVKRPGLGVNHPPHLEPSYKSASPLGLNRLFQGELHLYFTFYRARRPCCLRLRAAAALFMELRLRIPAGGMDVCLFCMLCCIAGIGIRDELITCPEEFYRVCVCVCVRACMYVCACVCVCVTKTTITLYTYNREGRRD